jgi:four helix bundle protein
LLKRANANLEIWQLAREVAIEIHKMSLEHLPKFEQFETGQQIRRSSKSTRSTIVEGYGRRTYQSEYFKFLTYAIASNDETTDHLESLFETGSLQDAETYERIHSKCELLGKKLNNFIKHFER